MSSYVTHEVGTSNTQSYRMYINTPSGPQSPFHDIPLFANGAKTLVNMVVEIPRWTNAKMEISKEEYMNPIKQDVKKEKLRYVHNVFPHKGYIWNYGALPQTWENPDHMDENTKCKGDDDPLDIIEIGSKILPRGAVVSVKPLGVLAMIDEGETDWKVVSIRSDDPLADKLNEIGDVEKVLPGLLDATRDWFKKYKVPSGKPENHFAFDGAFQNKEFTMKIIEETHYEWTKLISGILPGSKISKESVSVAGSPYLVTKEDAKAVVSKQPAHKPGSPVCDSALEEWHFV